MNNLERELQSGSIDNICQRCSGSGLKERKQREQQIQSLFVASSKRDDSTRNLRIQRNGPLLKRKTEFLLLNRNLGLLYFQVRPKSDLKALSISIPTFKEGARNKGNSFTLL